MASEVISTRENEAQSEEVNPLIVFGDSDVGNVVLKAGFDDNRIIQVT